MIILAGCSLHYSFTGATVPPGAKTFSVKTFTLADPQANPTYSQTITEAVKDLMLQQTRLDLADRNGDLQFEGTVTGYQISNAAVSEGDVTTLNRFTITVKVKFINLLDKDRNFDKTFSQYTDYDSNQDFSAVEDQLVSEIDKQLTQKIVDAAISNW